MSWPSDQRHRSRQLSKLLGGVIASALTTWMSLRKPRRLGCGPPASPRCSPTWGVSESRLPLPRPRSLVSPSIAGDVGKMSTRSIKTEGKKPTMDICISGPLHSGGPWSNPRSPRCHGTNPSCSTTHPDSSPDHREFFSFTSALPPAPGRMDDGDGTVWTQFRMQRAARRREHSPPDPDRADDRRDAHRVGKVWSMVGDPNVDWVIGRRRPKGFVHGLRRCRYAVCGDSGDGIPQIRVVWFPYGIWNELLTRDCAHS